MSLADGLPSLVGGLMLSGATSSLLVNNGRVLGISGLCHSVATSVVPTRKKHDNKHAVKAPGWKWAGVAGLLAGGALLGLYEPTLARLIGRPVFDGQTVPAINWTRILIAGLATGVGTKLGSGCTSGHMLCGLSRLSWRSFIATLTFFSVAFTTAHVSPNSMPLNGPSLSPALSLSTLLTLQLPLVLSNIVPRVLSGPIADSVSTFLTTMHFSFALALAGMLRPSTVISFFYLPVPGLATPPGRSWDPSLAFVALGGLVPNALVWQNVKRWSRPLLNDKWELPTKRDVDWRLVLGAATFGLGWGLMGICPGPLMTVLGSGRGLNVTAPFTAAFVTGGLLVDTLL